MIIDKILVEGKVMYRTGKIYTFNELGERVLASQGVVGETLEQVVRAEEKLECSFQ